MDPRLFRSPILFRGDAATAYRDPAIVYDGARFHLFFTLVRTEKDGVFLYTAKSESDDLISFTPPRILTARDRSRNFSSPGNIVRFGGRWVMCLQTYCRENGEKYGNEACRIYAMESDDLTHFDPPRLLRVKGNDVAPENMGRMIDPYLLEDKDEKGKWWCFYKQQGVSMSWSRDLIDWHYAGHTQAGENVCVVIRNGRYLMFHSPENGIGTLASDDLRTWQKAGPTITLGQAQWPWARGRLTAGAVLDLSGITGEPLYLLVFHASGPEDERTMFDSYASIGLAYSRDMISWQWN